MTTVFFLFLTHLALGLLLTLPLVPESAGTRYFKFCSAAAAFMSTAGLWLLARRYGWAGPVSADTSAYRAELSAVGLSLLFTVLYNRARHFGWSGIRTSFLYGAIACGVAAIALGDVGGHRWLLTATDLTSALLLGAATAAMVLGHWYLVVLDLPISALRRLTILLIVALALRSLVLGVALVGPVHTGLEDARLVAAGLWSPDGVFVWMRLLFGIAGPISLLWFIWKTVEIRSTQSATGILYVQLFLVLSGELLAKYLRVAAGLPL
jgi:protein NrfD